MTDRLLIVIGLCVAALALGEWAVLSDSDDRPDPGNLFEHRK